MIRRRDFLKRLIVGAIAVEELLESEVWLTPEIDLAALSDGAGRVSKKVDLGAGKLYHMVVDCEFGSRPDPGERVDFYLAPTPDTDLLHTQYLGSVITEEQDAPLRCARSLCTLIAPPDKHGFLIVDNHSGAELEDWDVGMIELKPTTHEYYLAWAPAGEET